MNIYEIYDISVYNSVYQIPDCPARIRDRANFSIAVAFFRQNNINRDAAIDTKIKNDTWFLRIPNAPPRLWTSVR